MPGPGCSAPRGGATPCSTAMAASSRLSAKCMRDRSMASACSKLSRPSGASNPCSGGASVAPSSARRRCPARRLTACRPAAPALRCRASAAARLPGAAACQSNARAAASMGSPTWDSTSQASARSGLKPGKDSRSAARRWRAWAVLPSSRARRTAANWLGWGASGWAGRRGGMGWAGVGCRCEAALSCSPGAKTCRGGTRSRGATRIAPHVGAWPWRAGAAMAAAGGLACSPLSIPFTASCSLLVAGSGSFQQWAGCIAGNATLGACHIPQN